MEHISELNPFKGYIEKFEKEKPERKMNPVHEIVDVYCQLRKLDPKDRKIFVGRFKYVKLAREAKILLENCGGNLEDALWSLYRMCCEAESKRFDWSISTCSKYKLV